MKILLAVDGSEHSEAATESLQGRAWPAGTTIEVIAVAEPVAVPPPRDSLDRLVEETAERLRAGLDDVHVTTRVVPGDPADVLLSEADALGTDLIVVGSRGRGAVSRFLLGSVSHKVLLHAPCSVEVVKPRQRGADAGLNILVPLDFSARSRVALDRISDLPWPPQCHVKLLAVVPPELPPDGAEISSVAALHGIEVSRAERERAEAAIAECRADLIGPFGDSNVSTEVIDGDPRQVILDAAEKWPASLIVMSSHGRTGLARLFLGSVAQAVVLQAPCSVQVVR